MRDESTEADRAIDATLAALRDAAPRGGMEARIQRAMQQEPVPLSLARRLRYAPAAVPVFAAVTACTSFALLTLMMVTFRHVQRDTPASAQTPRTTLPIPLAGSHREEQHPNRSPQPRRTPALVIARSAHPHNREERAVAATGWDEPAAAAINHPAPPLPLTKQEQLLLRLAHHGDAVQVASLDDYAKRSLDLEAQKLQFNEFFYIYARENTNDDNQQ